MKKIIFILFMFTILSIDKDHVVLFASSDMLTGTDSACEEYWNELSIYRATFKKVSIANKGWIPSNKIYIRN